MLECMDVCFGFVFYWVKWGLELVFEGVLQGLFVIEGEGQYVVQWYQVGVVGDVFYGQVQGQFIVYLVVVVQVVDGVFFLVCWVYVGL